MRSPDSTCACPDTEGHVTSYDGGENVWRCECMKCRARWREAVRECDAELIRFVRRGKPMLKLVKE